MSFAKNHQYCPDTQKIIKQKKYLLPLLRSQLSRVHRATTQRGVLLTGVDKWHAGYMVVSGLGLNALKWREDAEGEEWEVLKVI
jgi:hypothetical protein